MLIQTYNIYIVIYVSGWSDCYYNTFHVKLIWPFCSTYYLACRNIWWKNNLHEGGIQAIRISHALCPMHGELVIHFYPIVTIWNSCEYSELLGRLHVYALFSQILTCVDLHRVQRPKTMSFRYWRTVPVNNPALRVRDSITEDVKAFKHFYWRSCK